MHSRFLVIGAGLSGLAAAIRLARFNEDVLLIEKHSRAGGLNSYYYRHNRLFETGLHAITNYAPRSVKKAPLNRLLRQLKINRDEISFHEQTKSEIAFLPGNSLVFSNDFEELLSNIAIHFSSQTDGFAELVKKISDYDPFAPASYISSRQVLHSYISDQRLVDMILCPLLFYGSSWEDDIDFSQFVIMFRSIFLEGMFRPGGSIKQFLDLLLNKLKHFGGRIRLASEITRISHKDKKVNSVILDNGETITCDYLISTIGSDETTTLLGNKPITGTSGRLGFVENIFQIPSSTRALLPADRTCIFYNDGERFSFRKPDESVDLSSGVICLPFNFEGLEGERDFIEVRTTHLANFDIWHTVSSDKSRYEALKIEKAASSSAIAEKIIGSFSDQIVFQDSFTPLTIQRYTGKIEGAIYGSPHKIKNGITDYQNLFIAGTDQGFLGIVGSMLSGVSMVNQHILSRM
ncbi:MAG: NAD(P)/FAD-dependent oxidoreductase [Desulfocapsaceae bacterium]|nr:NAD(P)/FAD-dependent oxidoreductase [Desulfocapsaceae bacterium]